LWPAPWAVQVRAEAPHYRKNRDGFEAARSGEAARGGLGAEAELGGFEGVRLSHGFFGAVEAVEDELAEEAEADLAGDVEMMLATVIDEVDVIAGFLAGDVDVFAELDVALGAEDEGAAVAPGAETIGCEPIDADVVGRAVVADERSLAEVFEFGVIGIGVIGDGGLGDGGVGGAGKVEELFELVAADVAEDAAEFLAFKKPGRA